MPALQELRADANAPRLDCAVTGSGVTGWVWVSDVFPHCSCVFATNTCTCCCAFISSCCLQQLNPLQPHCLQTRAPVVVNFVSWLRGGLQCSRTLPPCPSFPFWVLSRWWTRRRAVPTSTKQRARPTCFFMHGCDNGPMAPVRHMALFRIDCRARNTRHRLFQRYDGSFANPAAGPQPWCAAKVHALRGLCRT